MSSQQAATLLGGLVTLTGAPSAPDRAPGAPRTCLALVAVPQAVRRAAPPAYLVGFHVTRGKELLAFKDAVKQAGLKWPSSVMVRRPPQAALLDAGVHVLSGAGARTRSPVEGVNAGASARR